MNLGRYTKALVPAVGSLFSVLYGWAATGQWDVPTLRLAAVGLVYAAVVYLLPNAAPVPPAPVILPVTASPESVTPSIPAPPLPGVLPCEAGLEPASVPG